MQRRQVKQIIKKDIREKKMAKLETTLTGSFTEIIKRIENGIIQGSVSASLEDSSDFHEGNSRCSVRVFERYSYIGSNRVSLSVTLFQSGDGPIRLSAITAGGSQAMFLKSIPLGKKRFWIS